MKNIFLKAIPGFLAVVLLLTLSFTIGPAKASTVSAANPPTTVVYNLFATDGYVQLADGTPLYIYGFVGGQSGKSLTFQNSVVAPPGAPKGFTLGGLTTIAGGPPLPTGGPVTAAELSLAGNAQFPAPLIYADVGDVVQINFKNLGVTNKNAPNDPHSIHLHGLDVDAANDGVPETSVGAVPANLAVPGAGNVVVYMFSPQYAGSYMYHCHQEADIHVQMGMYGALVVYNANDPASVNGPGTGAGQLYGWNYDRDVVMLLSEVDVRQHSSEQNALGGAAAFNPVNYQPQYWFINGLSFPNTVHAGAAAKGAIPFNWANWITAHPGYDPIIAGSVSKTTAFPSLAVLNPGPPPTYVSYPRSSAGDKVLIRVINMGFETQPMHMHGFHGKIIGSDQRAWVWANNPASTQFGQGLEKNTLTIGSGETYDWLVDFGQQALNSPYAVGTQSRYTVANNLPAGNALTVNPAIPVPFAPGSSYVGGPTVQGVVTEPALAAPSMNINQALAAASASTSQIFPFHNHDDYKATNNGVYPGGMFTVLVPLP